MSRVDCVVIGYNEGNFDDYRIMCDRAGPHSPERQIFSKEHLVVDGRHMPWLEAFSQIRQRELGDSSRYSVGEVFNLAALYLTSFLRRRGVSAEPVSLFGGELDHLADLLAERPAVVAVTTTFYVSIVPVLPVVEFVRLHSPTSRIVVGGPLVDNLCTNGLTDSVEDLFTTMGADYYIQDSQGESALVDLCRSVIAGDPPDKVDNVFHRTGDRWAMTRRRPESNDLDTAGIDWRSFDAGTIGVTAQMRSARSCAFKCSFCDYPSRAGALTTASLETVRDELRALAEIGVRNVVFVDDTFNVPPKRYKQICQMMIDEDFDFQWYSYFRCSNARDEESFDLAARSGCAGVFLGIESGDSSVLANMNKLAQDDQYRTGIRRLSDRGITTFASIIVGFPGESVQTIRNTIDFVNETAPTFWRAQAWWANPRSPVFQNQEALGIQGQGYTWSHRTMSSAEAADLTDVMFSEVSESTWLPLYDFDFWSLPYLSGKGVGVDQLAPLLRTTQELMAGRDLGADTSTSEARLTTQIRELSVAPSRFTYREMGR